MMQQCYLNNVNRLRKEGNKVKAEQLKKVVENHQRFIDLSDRAHVTWSCQFVEDLLRAELEHVKETEPQATTTIKELEKGIEAVKSLWFSIEDMETDDLVKLHIWNR